MKKLFRSLNLIFTIIMLSFMIIFFLKTQYHFLFYTATLYFIYLFYLHWESQKKYTVKSYIKILILFTIIIDLLGFSLHFYDTVYWFDKALHMFGSFSITLFSYALIQIFWKDFSSSHMLTFIFIASLGITIGVLYEIGEFILDLIFDSKNQNGLIDTNLDLIFDIFGAILASLWGVYRKRMVTLKR
ncbi:hypothetical protein [Inediibacterium massiliense]|uniref:hypothetical protein n=1 Tax=Inediibacterium massiliense TaxID=1658111 RepID=UPI0006B5F1C2|nr:hypothetical protein [Inediibacterium massiliense]